MLLGIHASDTEVLGFYFWLYLKLAANVLPGVQQKIA